MARLQRAQRASQIRKGPSSARVIQGIRQVEQECRQRGAGPVDDCVEEQSQTRVGGGGQGANEDESESQVRLCQRS